MHETRSLTMIKAVTYRVIVTLMLSVLSWIFTEDVGKTSAITIAYAILATVIYYFHERVWMSVKSEKGWQ